MHIIKKISSSIYVQHLIFWVLSFYFIGNYFSISNELKSIDFIYSAFFHIPLVLLVYFNLKILIPYFLQRAKYLYYVLMALLVIALAFFCHQLVFDILIPVLPAEFYIVSFTEPVVLITLFSVYLVFTTLLHLSKSWYELQEVEKEKLSLELNALKVQINPHFLFNSLNSIYSLTRKKSDKAPKAVLELSDLMRYMIYEVNDEKVGLQKEIDALKQYIALQKLRLEHNTDLKFELEVENPNQHIAPLLFFPLVENAFKHGLKADDNNYLHISLKSTKASLSFNVVNNIGVTEELENKKYGGIGLENVKRRLKLIYGSDARFTITETPAEFRAELTIDWND